MAALYEWSSIMAFDTRYRELQAEHDFAWGDLRMATNSTLLVPKRPSQVSASRLQASTSKTEECKRWLASGSKFCPFGANCRYLHRPQDNSTSQVNPNPPPAAKNGLTTPQ